MELSAHAITVRQFERSLTALKGMLTKAVRFAEEKEMSQADLWSSRLAPDQFPLSAQIQIACDNAKLCVSRLSGVEAPKHEDKEQTLTEFLDRIDSTIAFIRSVTPEQLANHQEKQARFHWNPGAHLQGTDYLIEFAIPNFYFHLTTGYSIMRNKGVPLGKSDYTGPLTWRKD